MITIENENLANYIMFKLDKLDNEFTLEELNQITEVVINYDDETDSSFGFLEELRKLENLKTITLRNGYIYNDNYNIFLSLKELDSFVFEKCEFENADLISSLKLKSLSLIDCRINNYTFTYTIETLERLSIVNGQVEIEKINSLKELNSLRLSYSKILDDSNIKINTLEELYIDNTNISNLSFLNNFDNLKLLSIDESQYNNNQDIIDNLEKNNVLVIYDGIVGYGGENNAI